jgi:signal transduction histidine kinase
MLNMPVPYEKLLLFQEKLGLTDEALLQLVPYRPLFALKKEEFASFFNDVFQSLPDAKLVLDYHQSPGHMLKVWAFWFEKIFNSSFDADLHTYLWRIGLRHVEVNLDQRYSNLGFSIIRQFCHKIVLADVEHGDKTAILQLIDQIMDFCLLVETSAYIDATTRCDMEIIKGIADRVRNPVTVIGGSIKRLQRKVDAGSPAYAAFDGLLGENKRLEHMVSDIKMYFDMFQEDPVFKTLSIEDIITKTVERLSMPISRIKTSLSPDALEIHADAKDIGSAFYHILENGIEASDPDHPEIRISSRLVNEPHRAVEIQIFNSGQPFKISDEDKLSTPFYSTKPSGTGFGIPIIRLAMRKNQGKAMFEPVQEEGTKVTLLLPPADY